MRGSNWVKSTLGGLAASVLVLGATAASAGASASLDLDFNTSTAGIQSGPVSTAPGGQVVFDIVYSPNENSTTNVSGALDYEASEFTAIVATVPGGSGGLPAICNAAAAGRVAFVTLSGTGEPLEAGIVCRVTLTAEADATEDGYELEFADLEFSDGDGVVSSGAANTVNVVGLQGPVVVVNPNGGEQTLTGGTAIGATNTFNFTASSVASPGDVGGVDATIDCGPASAGFTVAPLGVETFVAGTGRTVNYSVSCVREEGAQSGTLTCEVNDQNGARDVDFDLTCDAGLPIPGPTLTLSPDGGAFPLPGGLIDTVSSRNIVVNVTESGEAGGPDSIVTCATAAPFSLTGSPVTVAAGTAVGVAGSISVSCTRTDEDQLGTVTCDIDGGPDIEFAAVCPLGTTAPVVVPPTFIPSTSTWSAIALLSLLGVFGLLAVGFRRQG